jgi:hypothetical protein
VVACGAVVWGTAARAAETETREFAIHVDGKPAGQYAMTITKQDDGAEVMAVQASVRVKHLLGSYSYIYQGTEHWRDNRLVRMQSSTNDDGKRYQVQVTKEGSALRLRVNGRESLISADTWPSSYWRLPDARFHNKAIPLLDADCGKEMSGYLQYVGVQQLTVGGQPQNCHHFRVTGGPSPVDAWYDGSHRLVRQDFTVDGHRTQFSLTAVRR